MTTTNRRPAPPLLEGAPLIEVPTTHAGWATAAWKLSARIDAYVYWYMGGEIIRGPEHVFACDPPHVALVPGPRRRGCVPFRGAEYDVEELAGRVWDSSGWQAPTDVEQRVLAAVLRARETVRELPEVGELISMVRAINGYMDADTVPSFLYPHLPSPAELAHERQRARDALLWVAARSLTGLAQTVATTHARASFPGTCAELVEASTVAAAALAAAPVATTGPVTGRPHKVVS